MNPDTRKFKSGDEFKVSEAVGGTVLFTRKGEQYEVRWHMNGSRFNGAIDIEVLDVIATKVRKPFQMGDSIAPPDGGCFQDERIVLSEDGGRLQYVRRTKGTINFDNMVYTGAGGDFELVE